MTTKHQPKSRLRLRILVGYIATNLVLFFFDPYSSPWHYATQNPIPIEVATPTDSEMSLDRIMTILDSIDMAYGAREPSVSEQLWLSGERLIQIVFIPSSFALVMKGFMGYLGPANSNQRAFTISVKKRYNHLAKSAVNKGMRKDGYLFQEEPSLSKKNGESFVSLR